MKYHAKKLSIFIKFKRYENSMSQREFAEKIYVSRSLIDSIENGKLMKLDQHVHNIFECFHLDENQYRDDDQDIVGKFHEIIHQSIFYELPLNVEETLQQIYFLGIESTYLYLYYQLLKVCLYAHKYINDSILEKYFPIFDFFIEQFDKIIQEYYAISKYVYFKERRLFDLCVLDDHNQNFQKMDDIMKSYYYHAFAVRYMYQGDFALEFHYLNLAKEYCEKTGNLRRCIALTTIECDIYERLGNMDMVIELLKKNLVYMEEIHFMNLYDTFLSNLGITNYRIGDYINTVFYLEQSFIKNFDNLDLFYLVYSYMKLDNKMKVIELLQYHYQVKCFDEVFYDLLEWCRKSVKRPYTKKCEYLLQKIYKRYYKNTSLNTKVVILEMLIQHYEHHQDYYKVSTYQKELIELLK